MSAGRGGRAGLARRLMPGSLRDTRRPGGAAVCCLLPCTSGYALLTTTGEAQEAPEILPKDFGLSHQLGASSRPLTCCLWHRPASSRTDRYTPNLHTW